MTSPARRSGLKASILLLLLIVVGLGMLRMAVRIAFGGMRLILVVLLVGACYVVYRTYIDPQRRR